MSGRTLSVAGHECFATRSGYTGQRSLAYTRIRSSGSLSKVPPTYPSGEDGFEITVPNDDSARDIAALLLAEDEACIGRVLRPSEWAVLALCSCYYRTTTTATTTTNLYLRV